jgi:hypothetical protein
MTPQNDMKTIDFSQDVGAILYGDIPKAEQDKWLALALDSHPKACSFYMQKSAAYREIDMGYVFCEKDAAVPLFVQKGLVEGAKQAGAHVDEASLPASHFPMLSIPGELAKVITGLIK